MHHVELTDEFKDRVKAAYQNEKMWTKVKEVLESEDDSQEQENIAGAKDKAPRSRKTKLKFIVLR